MLNSSVHRVVIIGGGFGGLQAAISLRRATVQVTLIDRRNYHLFQPLLYQVATGALSPANIAGPLRALLRKQANARVLLGEVADIDVPHRHVILHDGEIIPYDTLIVAAGATHSYFGHPEWESLAPGLKTLEDATAIRAKILSAFETAERLTEPDQIAAWMTFVIVGGGPTGLEMAGAVAELSRETLRHNFRAIDPAHARILLVEATNRLIPPFPPDLSAKAQSAIERLGIQVRTNTVLTNITPEEVVLQSDGKTEHIPTRTVLWCAGVQASPLAKMLAQATGAHLDRAGRVQVGPVLTLPGHSEIFVIGDMALCFSEQGQPLPGVAPVAMQQGQYVAQLVKARHEGKVVPPFSYKDYGTMATIGRMKAVCNLFGYHFAGAFAWFVWLFIHLIQIVEFQNRVLVLIQWASHYVTRNRSARLITGTRNATEAEDI